MRALLTIVLSGLTSIGTPALADTYNLVIAPDTVNITGNPMKAITINGTIPGPT